MKYLGFLAFLVVLSIPCASAATDEVSGQHVKRRAQIHKLERSFVIKAPVSQMHDIWTTKLPLLSTICPDHIRGVELLQGRWGKEGSVIVWKFNLQGNPAVAKAILEVIDKENNRIVHKLIEGGPLDLYKSFRSIYQASPNENVVRWTVEYERNNEDVPEPNAYMDLLATMMKHIDAHLTGA